MKKYILLVSMIVNALLQISCGWNADRYQAEVNEQFENTVSVRFNFEKPYGSTLLIRDQQEIEKVKKWLLSATTPEAIGSYPDTLIPVNILNENGDSFSFSISPPLDEVEYIIIDWKGTLLIGKEFPIETIALENRSFDSGNLGSE
jgi:hypothetical protein